MLANGVKNAKILSEMFATDNRTWSEKKAEIQKKQEQQRAIEEMQRKAQAEKKAKADFANKYMTYTDGAHAPKIKLPGSGLLDAADAVKKKAIEDTKKPAIDYSKGAYVTDSNGNPMYLKYDVGKPAYVTNSNGNPVYLKYDAEKGAYMDDGSGNPKYLYYDAAKRNDERQSGTYDWASFLSAIGTNAKHALQNVGAGLGNSFRSYLISENEKSKHDPVLHFAENNGMIEKGFNEGYGKIMDEKNQRIEEAIRDDYIALSQKQQAELERYRDMPKPAQVTAQLVGGSAQLIPQIGVSMIEPSLGLSLLAGQVYGNSYGEAIAAGASREDAAAYGAMSAVTELAIEKAFGGIPKMGKGVLGDEIYSGVSKLVSNPTTQKTIKYIMNTVGEGAEEVASEFLAPYIKKATYDDNPEYPTIDDYLMAFGGGAVGSGLFGAAGYIGDLRNKGDIDPRMEVYRDTPLQKAGKSDILNLTEVVRDGGQTRGTQDTTTAGEKIPGTDGYQADDGGRNQADAGTESGIGRQLGQAIRDHGWYQGWEVRTKNGATQRYKEINPEVDKNGQSQRAEPSGGIPGTEQYRGDISRTGRAADAGTESGIGRGLVGSIRDGARYQERNVQAQNGIQQRYKEINPDVQLTPELQAIAEENARYGFSTAFVLDAEQQRDGVIKKLLGFRHADNVYLNLESAEPLVNVNRHELVHGGREKVPDAFDNLQSTFIENINQDSLLEALEYYSKKYAFIRRGDSQRFVEEFIADVASLMDNPPTRAIFADPDAVNGAYESFFDSLREKAAQSMPDATNMRDPAANVQNDYPATADAANQTVDVQAPTPNVQNDSGYAASGDSISQDAKNINQSNENMQSDKWGSDSEQHQKLHEAKERIAHYSEKTGRKVVWYNEKTNPELADTNGLMKDGVIYINENAQNPYMEVFKHELFHSLPADAKKAVIDFFRTHVNENTPEFRKFKAQEMQRQRQKNLKYSDADFWEEYAAQNAEFLLDEGYIEQIAKTDRNLAQRILDAIKQILERMKDVFAPDRYNYTEAVNSHESGKVSGMNDTQLRKAQRLYEKALYGVNENADGETKYSFAGEKAKTANRSLLRQAEQMAEQGASKEEILQKTGWFTGLDGKWRYELDDSKMQIAADRMKEKYDAWLEEDIRRWQKDDPNLSREEATAAIQQAEQMPLTLGEMLDYPELFAAYPELQDVNVWMMDEDSENSAEYNPDSNTILLYRDGIRNPKRSLIHEIQHIIQGIEGFAPGAPQDATGDAYRNNAGEIEARTAADRRNMTAEERRNNFPIQDEQNVVFAEDDGGTKYEIKTLPDGKRYVQADRKVITSDNPNYWGQEITDYINQKIRNGEDVAIPTEDGDVVLITEKTAWKMADRHAGSTRPSNEREYLSDTDYRTKANAAGHIDELLEVSKKSGVVEPDKQGKHGDFAKDGWQSRIAYFMDGDGQYYRMRISTAQNDNGTVAYNIGQIQRRSKPNRGGNSLKGSSVENNGARAKSASSVTDSIPPKGETVNTSIRNNDDDDTKFSMKQSQFYDSLQEADTVADEVKQGVQEQEDAFKYTPVANEQTMKQASERINTDPEKAAIQFMGTDSQHATTDDVATGFLLMKQYQDNGDFESAVEVAKKLSTLGTEAGRKVQIYSILERLTPEGMLKYATGELEKAKKLVAKEKGQLWMNEHGKQFDLTSDEAKWITDTMTRVQTMPDGRDRAVLIGEIQKMLQDKMPSTVGEKVAALQRISLLLNPKTVLSRNAVSNLLMNPVYAVNDFIASGIDKAVSQKTGVRTIAAPSYKQQWQGAKKGAYESFDDFRRGINTRDVEADNFRIGQGTPFKGKNKLSKALAKLDKLVSFALDAGDRPFYEGYFLESLNGQMKANHVAKPTADMIDIARQTALEKTWQDSNAVTRSANQLRDGMNKINKAFDLNTEFGLGNIIVPFVKTPSNIAKAIVEFSPAGLAKGLVVDGNKLLKAVKNGTATPQMQRAFCNNVAKGMTGTIMYIIGLVLAAKGVTTGSDDEKDKDVRNFKRNVQGIMQNSIKVGDRTYSYDWAQPIGGILTTAADIKNNTYSTDNMINTLTQAMTAGGNTLFEQSMLKGLSEFFGEYDGFMSSVARALAEAPTQFIPTALKQVAEVVDPVARSTKGDGILDTAKNKAMARIPGATKKLEPVVDVLGRDVMRYGGKNNLFNIFLNPANVNIANPTPATTEVWRLYEQTGNADVFPKVAPSSFTDDGVKYQMTPKEQTQFQRTMGQEADKQITALLNSPKYKNADDEKKAKMMEDAVEKSFDKAKKELIENRGEKPSKRLKKAVK